MLILLLVVAAATAAAAVATSSVVEWMNLDEMNEMGERAMVMAKNGGKLANGFQWVLLHIQAISV